MDVRWLGGRLMAADGLCLRGTQAPGRVDHTCKCINRWSMSTVSWMLGSTVYRAIWHHVPCLPGGVELQQVC